MTRKWIAIPALFVAGVLLTGLAAAKEPPRIAKEEVKAKLGSPAVVILDVRASKDWKKSDSKIQGAVREDPKKVKDWAKKYSQEKALIPYCA